MISRSSAATRPAHHTSSWLSPHQHAARTHRVPSCRAQQQQQHPELAAAAAAAAANASIAQLLQRRSATPLRYVGPIQVSCIPGKRFGLTASRNLSVGELLLVAPPLTLAFGPTGEAPGNDVLVQQLQGAQLEPWQLQWLRVLHREGQPGADAAAAAVASAADAVPSELQQQEAQAASAAGAGPDADAEAEAEALLPLLQQLLLQGPDAGAAAPPTNVQQPSSSPTAAAAAGQGRISIASVTCPFSAQQLSQIVAENTYCEPAEDLGAALLRELDPEAVAGLWPEFSLINHSCVPNTLAVCVGRYLLLHVTAAVLQGEELTCSYLGEKTFAPIGLRRACLRGVYGFHCVCERCVAEQRLFPTQYYPADDHVPGLATGSSSSSSSGGGGKGGGGLISQLLSAAAGLVPGGRQQQQQESTQPSAAAAVAAGKPNPSSQHRLLQEVHEAVQQELRPALAAAATADSRRAEQQLQLLAQVTELLDTLLDEVPAAVAADRYLTEQQAAAAKWLLAAAFPLMQLQLEAIELLLSGGELPVDETQLLLDEAANSSSSSSSGRGGAAGLARLSLNSPSSSSTRRSSKRRQGLPSWLSGVSGWLRQKGSSSSSSSSSSGGPVTKRQLLRLNAEALGRAVGVLDAVARGSEAHVVASIKHMDAVRQLAGPQAEETALAEGLCARAHAARYGVLRGPEGQALLARLISARRRQLLGASLARKMSVLAWEAATQR